MAEYMQKAWWLGCHVVVPGTDFGPRCENTSLENVQQVVVLVETFRHGYAIDAWMHRVYLDPDRRR